MLVVGLSKSLVPVETIRKSFFPESFQITLLILKYLVYFGTGFDDTGDIELLI
jgi:hypothetical protein